MPGSTEYSVAPVDLSGGSKTVVTNPILVDNPITTARLGDAYTNLPEVYKTQDFNEQDYRDKLLTTKYGTEASRRDKRKFKRYMQSEEGLAELDRARQAHKQAENQKWSQSLKARSQAMDQESARRREAMQAEWDAAIAQYDTGLPETSNSKVEAQDIKTRIASQARFNDAFRMARQAKLDTFTWNGKLYGTKLANEVAQPGSGAVNGSMNGARGSLSQEEIASWAGKDDWNEKEFRSLSEADRERIQKARRERVLKNRQSSGSNSGVTQTSEVSSRYNPNAPYGMWTNDTPHLREHYTYGGDNNFGRVNIEGRPYSVMVTTGIKNEDLGVLNDHTYAFDPSRGYMRAIEEDAFGNPTGRWLEGSDWIDAGILWDSALMVPGATTKNDYTPDKARRTTGIIDTANSAPLGGTYNPEYNPEYNAWLNGYLYAVNNPENYVEVRKRGGRLNRVNYFQSGGAVQKDAMAQVQALVQAAAQGDEQATQQITQILEAAKAGNQQAMQIAQMIQQVVEQMQGQATAAKWGAKLGYIKSLKYAKGGKTCPACEKKVEMKACGGKKAKKRYFGGLI